MMSTASEIRLKRQVNHTTLSRIAVGLQAKITPMADALFWGSQSPVPIRSTLGKIWVNAHKATFPRIYLERPND